MAIPTDKKIKKVRYNGVEIPLDGVTPTGSITIEANGTYDVTDKASAVVNVPSSSFQVGTAKVTAGSGAKSLAFHDLKGRPKWFYCIPNTITRNNSDMAHATAVCYDGTNTEGSFKVQNTHYRSTSVYSWTYSGTTLTIDMSKPSEASSYYFDTVQYNLTYGY